MKLGAEMERVMFDEVEVAERKRSSAAWRLLTVGVLFDSSREADSA